MPLQIRKTISLPVWDETTKQKILTYWEARGIVFTDTQGDVLTGRRGSMIGNLISFDMSKLLANLTVSRTGASEIECILEVNTILQIVTEWNTAYWQLEMDTLESWLLHNDGKEAEWRLFQRGMRKAATQWATSLGRRGNRLTPEVEETILGHNENHVLLRGSSMPTSELLRPIADADSTAAEEMLRSSDNPEKM